MHRVWDDKWDTATRCCLTPPVSWLFAAVGNADAGDRVAALAFLRRPDVQVRNWYRRHGNPAEAHLKAWIVDGAPPTVLTGSANLTSAGLFNNREVMAEIHGPDSETVIATVGDLVADAWDYKHKLIEVIDQPRAEHEDNIEQSSGPVSTRPDSMGPQQPRPAGGNIGQRRGCLLSLVVYTALLAGTLLAVVAT